MMLIHVKGCQANPITVTTVQKGITKYDLITPQSLNHDRTDGSGNRKSM